MVFVSLGSAVVAVTIDSYEEVVVKKETYTGSSCWGIRTHNILALVVVVVVVVVVVLQLG